MAVVVNEPSPNTPKPPVTNVDSRARPEATPTSGNNGEKLNAPTVTGSGDNIKVKGSAEADRISTKDLLIDSDKVIGTGAGDDVFIFRQDDATNSSLRNAVVDMGAGDNDRVVLANEISDYQITFRENGSIKFEYVGNGGTNNAAITFTGAEHFTFRNIVDTPSADPDAPKFYDAQTFTVSELAARFGVVFGHEAT
jgi:hypothetical protein